MVAEFSSIPPFKRHSTLGARLGVYVDLLGFWLLIITALATNLLNSISNPARNTILNQIAGQKLQIAISVSTGIGSIATMVGTRLAGKSTDSDSSISSFKAYSLPRAPSVCSDYALQSQRTGACSIIEQ